MFIRRATNLSKKIELKNSNFFSFLKVQSKLFASTIVYNNH